MSDLERQKRWLQEFKDYRADIEKYVELVQIGKNTFALNTTYQVSYLYTPKHRIWNRQFANGDIQDKPVFGHPSDLIRYILRRESKALHDIIEARKLRGHSYDKSHARDGALAVGIRELTAQGEELE